MPEKDRNEARELVIKERLTAHFKKHFHLLLHERKHVLRFGIWMVVTGVLCMLAAAAVMFKDPSHNLLLSFLVVFLEPAAWFLLWEGMDQIIFESKKLNGEVDFYRKMSHKEGHIVFKSY